jgi:hypothetical protein
MSQQLLSSKWIVKREAPKVVNIAAEATGITSFVGVTERGPIGEKVKISSWDEYVDTFGNVALNSDVSLAVYLFFEEGGSTCYVVRTVHYTNIDSPTSFIAVKGEKELSTDAVAPAKASVANTVILEPFALATGDTLVIEVVNDEVSSGDKTLTLTGVAPMKESTTSTYALVDEMTLTVKVDRGAVQTIEFLTSEFDNIAAATPAEVAAVINAKIHGAYATPTATTVQLRSDTAGTGGYIEITGGTANAILLFNTAEGHGTGNVLDINFVDADEIAALIDTLLATEGSASAVGSIITIESVGTGADSTIQVKAASTADGKIGFTNAVVAGTDGGAVVTATVSTKTEGAYGDRIQIKVENASSGVASEFNLTVMFDGYLEETFPNLTMDSTADRYCETVINAGSNYIAIEDEEPDGSALQRRPVNGTFTALTGGSDGLVGLVEADFIGSAAAENGLYALTGVTDSDTLAVPNYSSTAAVSGAMIQFCEVEMNGLMFAIIDPPSSANASAIVTWFEDTAMLTNLSELAAAYWPRTTITNKWASVFGSDATIPVPPSGQIAGLYARVDNSAPGGIYKTPAGTDEQGLLYTAKGFEGMTGDLKHDCEKESKKDIVDPKRINIITRDEGAIYVDGSYTLKSDGPFPFVAQSRGTIFISRSLIKGLQWVRHKRNSIKIRRRVERTVQKFLIDQMNVDAFSTKDPNTAFFLDVSDALNSPSVRAQNKLLVRIGLSYDDPIIHGVLLITKDTRALEAELSGENAA